MCFMMMWEWSENQGFVNYMVASVMVNLMRVMVRSLVMTNDVRF